MSEPQTLQEIRDWFAARNKWNKPGTWLPKTGDSKTDAMYRKWALEHWWKAGEADGNLMVSLSHPFPPTLDGAHGAMPEGWEWERSRFEWQSFKPTSSYSRMVGPVVARTDNAAHDLYLLAMCVTKAS